MKRHVQGYAYMCTLQTVLDKRVASQCLEAGDRLLAVVCVYGPNSSTEYPAFLGSLERGLGSASTGNSNVLLENFIDHMGNDCVT